LRARVRWPWLPLAATSLIVLLTVELWWSLTNLERLPGTLTIGMFMPLLVGLVILFLLASAILPDEVPTEGLNLRAF
jgi:polyferredoxin